MADEQADSSSVSRVGRILDSIDSFSKNFEYSDEPQNLILENNRTIEDKIPESVNDEAEPVIISPKSSTVVDNNTLDEKSAELIELKPIASAIEREGARHRQGQGGKA